MELENLLTRLKLEPIVLHRRPDKGRTIIEKFEAESKGSGYAFVLLTPDDDCLSDDETGERKKMKRARQNVVLEARIFHRKSRKGESMRYIQEGNRYSIQYRRCLVQEI